MSSTKTIALRRFLFRGVAVLLVVHVTVFVAFSLLPVDPARQMLGPMASEQAVMELRKEFGLDSPFPIRFLRTSWRFLNLDFGKSIYFREPAIDLVSSRMPLTMVRMLIALASGSLLAIAVTLVNAATIDVRLQSAFLIPASVPPLILVLTLLWFFSFTIGISPSSNRGLFEFLALAIPSAYSFGAIGLFLQERIHGNGVRLPRTTEFLQMIRLPPKDRALIIFRGSLAGMLSQIVNSATTVLSAVTFSEYVFGLPGFSVLFIKSCQRGDLAIVSSSTLVLAMILVVLNLLSESIGQFADPRLSFEPY